MLKWNFLITLLLHPPPKMWDFNQLEETKTLRVCVCSGTDSFYHQCEGIYKNGEHCIRSPQLWDCFKLGFKFEVTLGFRSRSGSRSRDSYRYWITKGPHKNRQTRRHAPWYPGQTACGATVSTSWSTARGEEQLHRTNIMNGVAR